LEKAKLEMKLENILLRMYSYYLGASPSQKRREAAGYPLYASHDTSIPCFYAAPPCRAPASASATRNNIS